LYQTLIGTFPFGEEDRGEFVERIRQYIIKAVREAKVHTAWLKPDRQYEEGFLRFIDQILPDNGTTPFLQDFIVFQKKVAFYGMLNGLSQALLKASCPGVPDYYQGTEVWDLSLVDPDNRRPVDFALRRRYLDEIRSAMAYDRGEFAARLLENYADGRIKLFVMAVILEARRKHRSVFDSGEYIPLAIRGVHRNHLIAFARHAGESWIIAVAPRRYASLVPPDVSPVGDIWKDTSIELPAEAPSHWEEEFSGKDFSSGSSLKVADICSRLPVCLLAGSSAAN
jgi:(1->4)-alpha-D-glucan 1-alpha-D-glucosylmutase